MKNFFGKISVLTIGCVLAITTSSCVGSSTNPITPTPTPTEVDPVVKVASHTIKGAIFDQSGNKLEGATVTVNDKAVTVSSNTFEATGLANGTYTIKITKDGYNDLVSSNITFVAKTENVNGTAVPVNQIAEANFNLIKKEEATISFGSAGSSDEIVLETSAQDLSGDGTNVVGNTQDPSDASKNSAIEATAETPGLTSTQVTAVEAQLPAGKTIADLTLSIANLSGTEAAQGPAARRAVVVAGDKLPGDYTFFTGLSIVTQFTVDLSKIDASLVIPVTFALPDNNMKKSIKLFRFYNNAWTEVTASTTGNGIASVDFTTDNKMIVKLNILAAQSFALGVQIDRTEASSETLSINELVVENTSGFDMTVSEGTYNMMSNGIILTNTTTGPMVDYLRKIVLRYYKLKAKEEAKQTTYIYPFNPAYKLSNYGKLYLAGSQTVSTVNYSVVGGTASFKAVEYGEPNVYPYAVVINPEPHHGGGTND